MHSSHKARSICAKGLLISNTRRSFPWELLMTHALDDPARKREGYKISQLECADHIESLETKKREQKHGTQEMGIKKEHTS
jgi:hypothetical protein